MRFTATFITSLLSLSAFATAYPSSYSESHQNTLQVRSADAYAAALDNIHSVYRRELDVRDEILRDILERAIVGWHDPNMLSGGKSGPRRAANAEKKKGHEQNASNWAEKNGYSHVTIHDPPHPSGQRKDGKPGDPKEHMTLVGHGGQPSMGDWHHVYNDGSHQALPPSRDPKPWSHLTGH
ncbi:hypothetical protein MMC11_006964 [Xylographa trunciseda]|nr:hypothetical protein [Xylographa trunciseda]